MRPTTITAPSVIIHNKDTFGYVLFGVSVFAFLGFALAQRKLRVLLRAVQSRWFRIENGKSDTVSSLQLLARRFYREPESRFRVW